MAARFWRKGIDEYHRSFSTNAPPRNREEEARKAMAGMGMSESVIDAFLEMERGFNEGRIRPTRERSPENTTPTTLEEFARTVYAPAFRAAA